MTVSSLTIAFIGPSKPKIRTPKTPKTIEAQDRSPITMTIGDNVRALTDTNITIQCHASGVPTPTITWSKDGKAINSEDRYTIKVDGSLVISEAGHEHSSRYTCTAYSAAGKDSASSTVQIVGKASSRSTGYVGRILFTRYHNCIVVLDMLYDV